MLAFEDWLTIRWRFLSHLKRHQKPGTEWHTSLKCYLAATPMNRVVIEGPKKKEILEHTGLAQSLRAVGWLTRVLDQMQSSKMRTLDEGGRGEERGTGKSW
jgi:hypothetical protein